MSHLDIQKLLSLCTVQAITRSFFFKAFRRRIDFKFTELAALMSLPENPPGAYAHVLSAIDDSDPTRSLSPRKVYAAATLCSAAYERDPVSYFRSQRHEFSLLRASDADIADHLVFVLAKDRNEIVYCAVRGTQTWENWKANLNLRSSLNIPSRSGLVHKGFLDYARSLPLADLELLHARGNTIVFCGHSMGGAVATLGMLLLISMVSEKTRLQSITFGAPMFCDASFLQEVRCLNQERLITNFVAEKDIIPIILRKCEVLRDSITTASETLFALTACRVLKWLVEPADAAASSLLSVWADSPMLKEQIVQSMSPILSQIVQSLLPTFVSCGKMIIISTTRMSDEEYLTSASTFAFPQSFQQHAMPFYLESILSACQPNLQLFLPENPPVFNLRETERFFIPRLEDTALLTCGIVETNSGVPLATRTIRVQLWGEYLGLVMPPINDPRVTVVQVSDNHIVNDIKVFSHSSTCMMLDILATGPVLSVPTALTLNLQSRVRLRPDGKPSLGSFDLPIVANFFQNRDARIRNGSFSQLLSEVVLLVLLSKRASLHDKHLENIYSSLQKLDAMVEDTCRKEGALPVVAAFHHLNMARALPKERDFLAELVTALASEEPQRNTALKKLVVDMCELIGIDPQSTEITHFQLIGCEKRLRGLQTFDFQSIVRDFFQNEVAFLCFLSISMMTVNDILVGVRDRARDRAQIGLQRMLISAAVGLALATFPVVPVAVVALKFWVASGALSVATATALFKFSAVTSAAVSVATALSEYRSASMLLGIRLLVVLSENGLCEFLHPSAPGQGQSDSLLDRENMVLGFFGNHGEVETHWEDFVGESLKTLPKDKRQEVARTFVSVLNPLVSLREAMIASKMFAVIVLGQPGAGKSRLVEDLFGLKWQRRTTVITPHALSTQLVVFDFPGAGDNTEMTQSMIGEQANHVHLGDMIVFLFKLDERSSIITEILTLRRLDKPMLFCLTCVDEFFLRNVQDHLGDGLSEHEAIAAALSAISAKVNEFCTLFGTVNKQSVRLICPARGAWDATTTRLAPGYPEELRTSGLVCDTFPVYEEICHQVQRAGFSVTQVVDKALREGLQHSYPARLAASVQ